MHNGIPINDGIHWIGVNDRDTKLFEELWPMPHGIVYNSYFIRDERTAVVDAVKDIYAADYLNKVKKILAGDNKIDYLIINHVEPDHSGAISTLLDVYPQMQIIGNKKTAELLSDFYGIRENIRVVSDGEELDLGRFKLKFFITPMVHWPETMMTYETTTRTLFSGDVFGGFATLDDGIFDDEIGDIRRYEDELLRYFVNVIGKYSLMVQKALAAIKDMDIGTVAPSHGPVWRKDPRRIIQLYDRWSRQEAEAGAVIVYASMYRNTERMMETVARAISGEGISRVLTHNVSRTHVSFILRDVWQNRALVIGTPTYNTTLFPLIDHFIRVLETKALKDRILGVFGSYGWTGGALKELIAFGERMEWELVAPVIEVKCAPTADNLDACRQLGRNIAGKIKERPGV